MLQGLGEHLGGVCVCGSGVGGVVGFTLGSGAWWCHWLKRSFRSTMAVSWWSLVICGASKSADVSMCNAWSRQLSVDRASVVRKLCCSSMVLKNMVCPVSALSRWKQQ